MPNLALLVCCHAARDTRCGKLGPPLAATLQRLVQQRGLDQEPPSLSASANDPAAASDSQPSSRSSGASPSTALPRVQVFGTSHIGGHKYAGNVLCYGAEHPCDGDWFGGVNSGNAEAFMEAILGIEVRCVLKEGLILCLCAGQVPAVAAAVKPGRAVAVAEQLLTALWLACWPHAAAGGGWWSRGSSAAALLARPSGLDKRRTAGVVGTGKEQAGHRVAGAV